MATSAQDVIDSFESSFQDKREIPYELEIMWLKKAVARFSVELDPIEFDADSEEFADDLSQYQIDTIGMFMKQMYMERELSRVNKRVSIVTRDFSIDGTGNAKTAAKNELDYVNSEAERMISNQLPTAYV